MAKFNLKNAEQVRTSVTEKELKQIRKLYVETNRIVTERIKRLGFGDVQKQNLILLQRELRNRIDKINKEIETGIISDMRTVSSAVVDDTREFLLKCGFKESEIIEAFLYVPDQIIRNISLGNVYEGNWSFSNAIWKNTKQIQDVINQVISKGVGSGMTTQEIAKLLERYIDPSSTTESRKIKFQKYQRDENGKIMYDKNGKPIPVGKTDTFYFGKIDYNAQRLARTLISHAYQQAFMAVNEKNPFVESYIWHSAGLHGRTCSICLGRDGQKFKKDELPLDHPNGMCTFEAYIPDSMSEIARKIGDWYNAPTGTYPDIDEYALSFI